MEENPVGGLENMKYGLQLYSVRDMTKQHFEDALRQVALMGYDMVEPAGFFDKSAEDVAAMLARYNLTVCSTHTKLRELCDNLDETVAYHKAIGCYDIIIPGAHHSTAQELDELIEKINGLIPKLREHGMRLHYHNHWQEFRPNKDGLIVMEELAKRTEVLFEIDTFWAFDAGMDPLAVIEQYRDRISVIHLKDGFRQDFSNAESEAIGKSLGLGETPVAEIRKKAIEMGLKIVVESEGLEPTGIEEVKRCIDYLKQLDKKDVS